jgi:hypothetical protein
MVFVEQAQAAVLGGGTLPGHHPPQVVAQAGQRRPHSRRVLLDGARAHAQRARLRAHVGQGEAAAGGQRLQVGVRRQHAPLRVQRDRRLDLWRGDVGHDGRLLPGVRGRQRRLAADAHPRRFLRGRVDVLPRPRGARRRRRGRRRRLHRLGHQPPAGGDAGRHVRPQLAQ